VSKYKYLSAFQTALMFNPNQFESSFSTSATYTILLLETPNSDMTTEVGSKYWLYHVWFVVIYPLFIPFLIVFSAFEETIIGSAVAMIYVVITAVAAVGSLIGYYVEAQRFSESDSEWVPKWTAYAVLHFIFSPFIIAPVYLFDRWRAVGIPWRSLK
jgi:hypothetical protein